MIGAGVGVAVLARLDPGYVVVAWNDWQLEIRSLAVAVLVLVAAFYLLHVLALALRGARGVPARWRGRRARRAARDLEAGVQWLAREEYARADGVLLRTNPGVLHYLAAAWAAQRRGAPARREELLARARADARAEPAATLLEAHCLIDAGLPHAAEAALDRLRGAAARSPGALRLMMEARRRAGSHWGVITLLGPLRRAGVVDEARARQLEHEAHAALLASVPDPRAHWGRMSRKLREQPALVAALAGALVRAEQVDAALTVLADAIAARPDPTLTALYGEIEGTDAAAQLARAEAWLETRPRDAVLLHALGRIAARAVQWSRARSFLEAAVSLAPNPAARCELAELLLDLGERDAALAHFRAGLRDATQAPPPA